MSFKVTYKEISNYEFQAAMGKMSNTVFSDGGRIAYLVKKMNQALTRIRKQITDEYKAEILEKYAEKDAEGKYDEAAFKPIPGKEEELKAAIDTFEAKTVEIDRPKFVAADIKEAKFNAIDLEAFDPVFDESTFELQDKFKRPRAI
jgi:hypothetical protein